MRVAKEGASGNLGVVGGPSIAFGAVCVLFLGACAPCGEDPLEPSDSDSPATGGDLSFDLNEIDLNFHDQSDVDCVTFEIPDPSAANDPRVYVEILGGEEKIDLSITFSCASGDPAAFSCNGEEPAEPTCAKTGEEPNLGFIYDCDGADDAQLGDSSIVVCATRPSADKLCVDYTLRAYLN